MGALRCARRPLAAIAFAGLAVVGGAACEPASAGGLTAVGVAVTTDKTATSTFERLDIDVRWLSCTATIRGRARATAGATGTPSRAPAPSAAVDCRGETAADGDIRITGEVTDERAGKCVRGDLTAKIDGRIAFQATMLGACDAAATRTPTTTHRPTTTPRPTTVPRPTVTTTAAPKPPATPPATVTVTVTADPSSSAK
ncbi:hypothetical protein OHS70_25070 [Streptomyces sp. NBC_00390]|uniref:hypothetical protein n=1 Tax=Streptomyces sp. NBC_00390 TaxID=2975736 RepID=UPI002E1C369D